MQQHADGVVLQEGGSLPEKGQLASGEGEGTAILAAAAAQGLDLASGPAEWRDNALFAGASG